jgi:hypothetical protein
MEHSEPIGYGGHISVHWVILHTFPSSTYMVMVRVLCFICYFSDIIVASSTPYRGNGMS